MDESKHQWQGFAELDVDSDKYKQVRQLFDSANFEHLATRALETRKRVEPDLPPHTKCCIDHTSFASGRYNVVLQIWFSDHVRWIARIPYQSLDDGNRISMLSEIATMRLIKKHTTIPIPRVFDFELTAEQPFGYPYVFMECLSGHTLPDLIASAVPEQHHAKVAKQLADVLAELQNLTFSRIGRLWCGEDAEQPLEIIPMGWHSSPGPLDTSLEYFYNERQGENRQILALHPGDADWMTAGWVLTTSLAHLIIEDRVRGPFPLCHLDLHYGNMLFDNEYNLTGIVDWSNVQAAPLEQLSVTPELITFPGLSHEDNRPNIELRRLVVESIREKEKIQKRGPPLDIPAGMTPDQSLTPLSTFMASKAAEITHRQYMSSPKTLLAGRTVAKLIYGESLTWEQLREVYGTMPLFKLSR